MKKILIATHNPAKLKELKKGFASLHKKGVKILSLDDLRITIAPKETGKTFKENAIIKAKYYGDLTGLPTVADDGGLMIDVLAGEPGVKSRRWIGEEATEEEKIIYTLKKLQGLPKEERTACLKVAVCFYHPKTKKIICEEEQVNGYIADKPSKKRVRGYPFRSLFIVSKFNKYYDELTEEEHESVNHRLKAVKKLVTKLI